MIDPSVSEIYNAILILLCVIAGAIWVFTRDYDK